MITIGVDAHKAVHVAVALDERSERVGVGDLPGPARLGRDAPVQIAAERGARDRVGAARVAREREQSDEEPGPLHRHTGALHRDQLTRRLVAETHVAGQRLVADGWHREHGAIARRYGQAMATLLAD